MQAAQSKAAGQGVARPPKSNLNRSWKHLVEPLEPFLETVTQGLMRQAHDFDPQIVPYAKYALAGGGKRLRPALVALAARSLGPVKEDHVTAAVIIEMVHLATLVHDDVMDEAEIRRGQPTLAAKYGNEVAVLFGDCLFAQAVKLAAGFNMPEVCRMIAEATNTVCTGEILQTQQRRNFAASRRDYFRVIEMKTAELFTLSCDLAAFLSGAPAGQRVALGDFGTAFGTAYQVYDDCVDLFGTEADRARLEGMIENWQPGNLAGVNELLARHETLEPSLAVVGQYLEAARGALKGLPESGGRAGLLGLAEFLAQQTDDLAVSI